MPAIPEGLKQMGRIRVRESLIERKTCRFARSRGWTVHPKAAAGMRGWPDRTFSRVDRGQVRLVLIEFKAPGGKPTPLQSRTISKLRAAGYEVHVIDSISAGTALFT